MYGSSESFSRLAGPFLPAVQDARHMDPMPFGRLRDPFNILGALFGDPLFGILFFRKALTMLNQKKRHLHPLRIPAWILILLLPEILYSQSPGPPPVFASNVPDR